MTQVLAEVMRSGFVEGHHHGTLVALAADGSPAFTAGSVHLPIYPRSANKPLQAAGMVRAGLELDGELLALAASSHSGQSFHLEGVRTMLGAAGLTAQDLQTPPDLPLDEAEARALVRAGAELDRVTMNCSGKHAAMLATCTLNAWPTSTYLDPTHPLQQAIQETVEDLAGEQVAATGVDGCGAPLFALTLGGVARAFRLLALADPATAEGRVAAAMRAHPEYVGGTGRDVTQLMAGVPGLLAKDGAEGVYAATLPDGRAVALKIDDGAQRARMPVLVAALRRMGVDAPVLDQFSTTPVYGGGQVVGEVRAVPPLSR